MVSVGSENEPAKAMLLPEAGSGHSSPEDVYLTPVTFIRSDFVVFVQVSPENVLDCTVTEHGPDTPITMPVVIDTLNDPPPNAAVTVNVHAVESVTVALPEIPAYVSVQPVHVVPAAAADALEPDTVPVMVQEVHRNTLLAIEMTIGPVLTNDALLPGGLEVIVADAVGTATSSRMTSKEPHTADLMEDMA